MKLIKKAICLIVAVTFFVTSLYTPDARAQVFLPAVGMRVSLTPAFTPDIIRGMTIDPKNPFAFSFLVDQGDKPLPAGEQKDAYLKLIKYFMAAMTIAEDKQWVNLSPYEGKRIIDNDFGKTEMGRDLLGQDYILKQLTASLLYPEDAIGKEFWQKVYKEAAQKYGTTQIPVNTFNKVWIVPETASVYEKDNTVLIVNSKLKVMLEEDYLSTMKHESVHPAEGTQAIVRKILSEIVIPALTKEVNEGKNFANLRQIYHSMILATWYKQALRKSILTQIYANKDKVKGVDLANPLQAQQQVYQQYLKAFKKGAYNFIKEEQDPLTGQVIPRKYFSGGFNRSNATITEANAAMAAGVYNKFKVGLVIVSAVVISAAASGLILYPLVESLKTKKSHIIHQLPTTQNKKPQQAPYADGFTIKVGDILNDTDRITGRAYVVKVDTLESFPFSESKFVARNELVSGDPVSFKESTAQTIYVSNNVDHPSNISHVEDHAMVESRIQEFIKKNVTFTSLSDGVERASFHGDEKTFALVNKFVEAIKPDLAQLGVGVVVSKPGKNVNIDLAMAGKYPITILTHFLTGVVALLLGFMITKYYDDRIAGPDSRIEKAVTNGSITKQMLIEENEFKSDLMDLAVKAWLRYGVPSGARDSFSLKKIEDSWAETPLSEYNLKDFENYVLNADGHSDSVTQVVAFHIIRTEALNGKYDADDLYNNITGPQFSSNGRTPIPGKIWEEANSDLQDIVDGKITLKGISKESAESELKDEFNPNNKAMLASQVQEFMNRVTITPDGDNTRLDIKVNPEVAKAVLSILKKNGINVSYDNAQISVFVKKHLTRAAIAFLMLLEGLYFKSTPPDSRVQPQITFNGVKIRVGGELTYADGKTYSVEKIIKTYDNTKEKDDVILERYDYDKGDLYYHLLIKPGAKSNPTLMEATADDKVVASLQWVDTQKEGEYLILLLLTSVGIVELGIAGMYPILKRSGIRITNNSEAMRVKNTLQSPENEQYLAKAVQDFAKGHPGQKTDAAMMHSFQQMIELLQVIPPSKIDEFLQNNFTTYEKKKIWPIFDNIRDKKNEGSFLRVLENSGYSEKEFDEITARLAKKFSWSKENIFRIGALIVALILFTSTLQASRDVFILHKDYEQLPWWIHLVDLVFDLVSGYLVLTSSQVPMAKKFMTIDRYNQTTKKELTYQDIEDDFEKFYDSKKSFYESIGIKKPYIYEPTIRNNRVETELPFWSLTMVYIDMSIVKNPKINSKVRKEYMKKLSDSINKAIQIDRSFFKRVAIFKKLADILIQEYEIYGDEFSYQALLKLDELAYYGSDLHAFAVNLQKEVEDNNRSRNLVDQLDDVIGHPYVQEHKKDDAMLNGGIDLNSANLNLSIKRDGNGVPLPLGEQDMAMLNAPGFLPVITDIEPADNLPILLQLRALAAH